MHTLITHEVIILHVHHLLLLFKGIGFSIATSQRRLRLPFIIGILSLRPRRYYGLFIPTLSLLWIMCASIYGSFRYVHLWLACFIICLLPQFFILLHILLPLHHHRWPTLICDLLSEHWLLLLIVSLSDRRKITCVVEKMILEIYTSSSLN